MTTLLEERRMDARAQLRDHWANADTVIAVAEKHNYGDTFKNFLTHCTACGGNWCGMLLTGIRKLYPDVWDAIPDDMGLYAFYDICAVLVLCGVRGVMLED